MLHSENERAQKEKQIFRTKSCHSVSPPIFFHFFFPLRKKANKLKTNM